MMMMIGEAGTCGVDKKILINLPNLFGKKTILLQNYFEAPAKVEIEMSGAAVVWLDFVASRRCCCWLLLLLLLLLTTNQLADLKKQFWRQKNVGGL